MTNESSPPTPPADKGLSILPVLDPESSVTDQSVQVNIVPHVESKQIQSKQQKITTSPIKVKIVSVKTSPIKMFRFVYSSSKSNEASEATKQVTTGSVSLSSDEEKKDLKQPISSVTTKLINASSTMYIGIPQDCKFLVDVLSNQLRIDLRDIILCLRKIRLNESFGILGDGFGLSSTTASRIFSKTVPKLSEGLQNFITNPSNKNVFKNLTPAFRCNFGKTTFIIHGLEIEIEKPLNSVHQALTGFEYKKCNTLKYLISLHS